MNSINEKDPGRAAQIERIISQALNSFQRTWLTEEESSPSSKVPSVGENFHSSNSTLGNL